jgi:hypothetical protein
LHSFVAALPHLLEMKKSITAHVNIAALLTAATEHDAALGTRVSQCRMTRQA